ncbi:MAG: hypothetical protein JWQ49_5861 [Edaphobacter sp.]|nr:hypothetical protein [Edaphobacter sp.]
MSRFKFGKGKHHIFDLLELQPLELLPSDLLRPLGAL